MADERKTEPKSDEQDKQRLPSRDDKSRQPGGKGAESSATDAPMDPEDEAFIKKNK